MALGVFFLIIKKIIGKKILILLKMWDYVLLDCSKTIIRKKMYKKWTKKTKNTTTNKKRTLC